MRVLIVQVAALGDVVMASTMIGAVRERWPAARITWVTDGAFAPVVRRFDGVDEVRAVNAEAILRRGSWLRRGAALLGVRTRIGRGPWDLVLIGHRDHRYEWMVPRTRGAERRRRPVPARRAIKAVPARWMGEEYADLVHRDLLVASGGRRAARLARLRSSEPSDARERIPGVVLLAPGGGRNVLRDQPLKRWPIDRWVTLARGLEAAGVPLGIIGDHRDVAEAAAIRAAVPAVHDWSARASLEALLDRIAMSSLLITHDSGPMHLAMLTRTPVIALFGPTDPATFIDPEADVRVLSAAAGLPCAPCYDGRDYAVCGANRCLTGVSADTVLQTALQMALGAHSVR